MAAIKKIQEALARILFELPLRDGREPLFANYADFGRVAYAIPEGQQVYSSANTAAGAISGYFTGKRASNSNLPTVILGAAKRRLNHRHDAPEWLERIEQCFAGKIPQVPTVKPIEAGDPSVYASLFQELEPEIHEHLTRLIEELKEAHDFPLSPSTLRELFRDYLASR